MNNIFKARQIIFKNGSSIVCPPLTYDEYIEIDKSWIGASDIVWKEYLRKFDFTEISEINRETRHEGFTVIPLSKILIDMCFPTKELRDYKTNKPIAITYQHPLHDGYFDSIDEYSAKYNAAARFNILSYPY